MVKTLPLWEPLLGSGTRDTMTGCPRDPKGRSAVTWQEFPWLGRAGEHTDAVGNQGLVSGNESQRDLTQGLTPVRLSRGELPCKQKKCRIGLDK